MDNRQKVTTLFMKTNFLENQPGEIKVIYIYRYMSLLLTSLFYLIGTPSVPIIFKIGVIFLLYLSAKIMMGFYIKLHKNVFIMKVLVLLESSGIILLLFPSGGISSPFIWYALNPVLVAANYLNTIFCWLTLTLYLVSATAISINFINHYNQSIIEMTKENAHLVLVFVLITLAVQLLSNLCKKLHEQSHHLVIQKRELLKANDALQQLNGSLEESMEHIMDLYQAVEIFTNQNNRQNLFQVFADYTEKLTKTNLAFFCGLPYSKYREIITVSNDKSINNEKLQIKKAIQEYGDSFKHTAYPMEFIINAQRYSLIKVKSSTNRYGLIGIQLEDETQLNGLRLRQLYFLANLCTVILERLELEEIEEQLMLVEEQNRIANEIHDNVSQRLFSITYAIHALNGKWQSISNDRLKVQLEHIRQSANEAMQDLRASIYRLSSRKRGEKSLHKTINTYLNSLANLNGITVDFEIKGEEELIPNPVKKAFFRLIREATGNAVRHGRCKEIQVEIHVEKGKIVLMVRDDGKGFNFSALQQTQHSGLGIGNMKNLVEAFGGEFQLYSQLGNGTKIHITIPTNRGSIEEEGGLAI
ncbi:sensor histidine kinase [Natronincola ferrireducens]|uniref:sensor histidine kinase n=1 Tax=Natronincola ferrireducens TaxID=393762 RepID=UPI0015A3D3E0|nr:sensor histidine kinase [Natronincola ferrireducens]